MKVACSPTIDGIECSTPPEEQFDGIAEVTFETEQDQTWFKAAAILMDDEHNLFSKAIGYNTSPEFQNLCWWHYGWPQRSAGYPEVPRYGQEIWCRRSVVSQIYDEQLCSCCPEWLGSQVHCICLRSRQFTSRCRWSISLWTTRFAVSGGFWNCFLESLEMEGSLPQKEYARAVKNDENVKQLIHFRAKCLHFVYDSHMTLAGQRSSKVAELIAKIEQPISWSRT